MPILRWEIVLISDMGKCRILLILLYGSLHAGAQNDPPDALPDLTISNFHINDSLMRAPAAIGILSSEALTRNNQSDIGSAINLVPGVLMQSGAINTNRISIRGIGARTSFGTNKIRAFFGNIPLTSGDSETTIEDLNVEAIGKVEVIRGPLSSVYGAGLGGAILMSPLRPGNSEVLLSTVYGSFGLAKTNLNLAFAGKTSSHNINYHKLESDGWRRNSSYDRDGFTVSGDLFRKGSRKLYYIAGFTKMKAYIPSSVTRESFENDPQAAAPTWLASQGFEQYESVIAALGYDFKLFGLSNSTSIFINYKDSYEPRPFDILAQQTKGFGARTQFSGEFLKDIGRFIFGAEFFQDGYGAETFENLYQENNNNGSLQGDQLSESSQDRSHYNLFGQFRISLFRRCSLQGGVNYNMTEFRIDNSLPERNIQKYQYDNILAPQVSLLYEPSLVTTVYASASRGFSMPAIEETLNENGTVNPGIRPETGYNFEAGAKFYLMDRALFLQVSAFAMKIRDLLVARRVDDDQYVGANAGRTFHRGVEAEATYNVSLTPGTKLQLQFSGSAGRFSFEDFVDRDTDFSGNDLPGVPQVVGNAGFTISRAGFYLLGDFRFVDSMWMNDGNSESSDAYRIVNMKSGYRFNMFHHMHGEVSTGVNNLFNEKYASMILPNATGFNGAQPRFFYPGLPLNFYFAFSFAYKFE